MEGGYVNEGGQLKTKNGQKYIVNEQRDGVFITKSFAILSAVITFLALIIAILITYFLARNDVSCSGQSIPNENIASAGLLPLSKANGHGVNMDVNGAMIADEGIELKEIKLYEGWNPELYTLIIEPNLEKSTNNGTVSIKVKRDLAVESLKPIVLDVNNITITNVKVMRFNENDEIPVGYKNGYGENNDTYFIEITSGYDLKNDKDLALLIQLDFISQLTNTLQGVYKTNYENTVSGNTEWMISTQFSPIDARRAFPCIDRPEKKANFSISVILEVDKIMALSNMPSKSRIHERPGYLREEFETTPKMSTYLVALIVSNLVKSNINRTAFDFDDNKSPNIDIWTRQEFSEMTNYAYRLTRKVLLFYEKFFGIQYKFHKIDLVAIPDFGYGAMENWGLITFRESSILVPDEELESSAAHMEIVSTTVAHELAHQWFGNLVTMKWWDDLWLKEGFASYLSYLAVNSVYPDWKVLESLPMNDFRFAMKDDSDISSHPIFFPVKNTADVRRVFDSITYSKGNIIVRMVNSFLGDRAFKMSLRDFLKEYSYMSADRDDLWKLMTAHGHGLSTLPKEMSVKEIMDSWTHQAGYPVVTVKRLNTSIVLKQERFLLPKNNPADKSKWFIPITYATDEKRPGDDIPMHWLTNQQEEIIIPDIFSKLNNSDNYLYLNLDRKSYYRVNYDYVSWIALKKHFALLPKVTRAQLLDDALHLARAEYLSYDIPLTFLMTLQTYADDHLLWASAEEGISYLVYMLQREPAFENFRAFMRFLVRPAYDYFKLDEPTDETHIQLMHRARVIRIACKFNYDRCTNAAQLKYRDWMRDTKNNLIRPNLKESIYCTAMQEGSYHEWYFAYKRYQRTTSASEKEQILSAMGCTNKPWLLSKYLNMTIDSEAGIRKQDGARAFSAVAKNPIAYEIAFDFLVTNIKEIAEYYGDGFATLSSMIESITTYMNKDYQLEQLQRFAEKTKKLGLKSVNQSIKLATEKVKTNIFWRTRSYHHLKRFLEGITKEFHINLY